MTTRVRRARVGGAVLAVAIAAACTKVSTDPNSVLSIQLSAPILPSVVKGDSSHDTTGAVIPIPAAAYNAQGDSIPGAPIRYLVIQGRDTLAVDTLTGVLFGIDSGSARVIAYVPGLQTLPQQVFVVLSPDSLSPLDSAHYALDYNQGTLRDTLLPIRVRLLHVTPLDTTGITHYRLKYAFTYPAGLTNLNPDTVQLVGTANLPQLVDTTTLGAATGVSTLNLRATLLAKPYADTVGIDVFAFRQDNTPVPGSPVHFVITLTIH